MDRRAFVTGFVCLLAVSLAAEVQPGTRQSARELPTRQRESTDVSINCRTDGRSHEQYMLAHDAARELEGFEEVGDLGRAAFWIATAPGNGSLEVEVDNARVLIVSVFSVPDGRELAGARALAEAVLSDL